MQLFLKCVFILQKKHVKEKHPNFHITEYDLGNSIAINKYCSHWYNQVLLWCNHVIPVLYLFSQNGNWSICLLQANIPKKCTMPLYKAGIFIAIFINTRYTESYKSFRKCWCQLIFTGNVVSLKCRVFSNRYCKTGEPVENPYEQLFPHCTFPTAYLRSWGIFFLQPLNAFKQH